MKHHGWGMCVLFDIAVRFGVGERRSVRRDEMDISGVQIMGGISGAVVTRSDGPFIKAKASLLARRA